MFFSIEPTPENLIIVMAVGFLVATAGVLMVLFLPKTNLIFSGAEVDENFKIIKASEGSKHSSAVQQVKDKFLRRTGLHDKMSRQSRQSRRSCEDEAIERPSYRSTTKQQLSSLKVRVAEKKPSKSHVENQSGKYAPSV